MQESPGPGTGLGDPAVGSTGLFGPILVRIRSPLLRYVLRRVAWSVLLLTLVSFLTFVIFYVLPTTDPAILRAGRNATPELIEEVRTKLGLDKPAYEQFWIYGKGVVTEFDLGYSYYSEVPVREEIFSRLPASISVALGAFILWMAIALPVGILTALKPRSKTDRVVTGTTLFFLSAPTYWLALVTLFLFASDIGRFKLIGGAGTYVPLSEDPRAWFESLFWPWIVLALGFAGFYSRMIGENLRDAMAQDYVRTARAKGLSERRIVLRHGLRAALTPIVTLAALDFGILLGGTVLVETVFNIPGIGRYAVDAIQNGDLPAIQGVVLFGAIFIVFAILVADILYALLDPRVRY